MRKRKRNPLIEELMNNIPEDVQRRVEKSMTCKWLIYGSECKKGLPGTPCVPDCCTAWEHYKEGEK